MVKKAETEVITENELVIKFKKPYTFEGKEYNEIDLSGLEDLTTSDLESIDKMYTAKQEVDILKELSVGYACIIASKTSSLPIEFFQQLPAREGIRLKLLVSKFFFN